MGSSTHIPTVNFNSAPREGERVLILACDKYIDAEKWVNAIQLRILMSANSHNRSDVTSHDLANLYAPPPDVRLTDVEEWVKSAKWAVNNVIHGLRILELTSDSKSDTYYNYSSNNKTNPCLRVNMFLGCSTGEVFGAVMNYPAGCRTGAIKSVRVIEYIDNSTDIIHIALNPVYLYPTWTGNIMYSINQCNIIQYSVF